MTLDYTLVSEPEAEQMRADRAAGMSLRELEEKYGRAYETVRRYVVPGAKEWRRNWQRARVKQKAEEKGITKKASTNIRVSDEEANEMRALRAQGRTYREIAEYIGCCDYTVRMHVKEGFKEQIMRAKARRIPRFTEGAAA